MRKLLPQLGNDLPGTPVDRFGTLKAVGYRIKHFGWKFTDSGHPVPPCDLAVPVQPHPRRMPAARKSADMSHGAISVSPDPAGCVLRQKYYLHSKKTGNLFFVLARLRL
jgi:hypothetical protein